MTALNFFSRIEGRNLVLRLIELEDAPYVYGLRMNPAYNRHLSPVSGSVADQREWIANYKTREADRRELYYVIERRNGAPCGTVRLYDIGNESFTWGSWILDHNKPPKAALESAILSFGLGFRELGCKIANIDVRLGNTKAEAFYRRLSMRELGQNERDMFFAYDRETFEADLPMYKNIIQRASRI
ncbi:GNAT family N-acetyltransferase [Qipengyuania gaetbuli]|uniref:GNAT family N-acetyltransferase n=1 Tax=Qipengyuania gaetbuli TaxID=266952 RepID=UPI001CD670CD|nr:GNAT family N-acetyltransferase [Qipengyuania gaetbuli]MCA0911023.1 GNAT family N-acetyltransferase [Qipengyuania gaetbuli]